MVILTGIFSGIIYQRSQCIDNVQCMPFNQSGSNNIICKHIPRTDIEPLKNGMIGIFSITSILVVIYLLSEYENQALFWMMAI